MCSPRTVTDANRKPTRTEIKTCSGWLQRTFDLIYPLVVATLGSEALDAIKAIEPHELKLKSDAGRPVRWNGHTTLLPLYHPSPQVIAAQRGLDLQLEHFARLGKLIEVVPDRTVT